MYIIRYIVQVSFITVVYHNVLESAMVQFSHNQLYILTFREDRLTIYDEVHANTQSTETIMCGSDPPHQVALRSNRILLNFKTGSNIGDAGFRIKIERGK